MGQLDPFAFERVNGLVRIMFYLQRVNKHNEEKMIKRK